MHDLDLTANWAGILSLIIFLVAYIAADLCRIHPYAEIQASIACCGFDLDLHRLCGGRDVRGRT